MPHHSQPPAHPPRIHKSLRTPAMRTGSWAGFQLVPGCQRPGKCSRPQPCTLLSHLSPEAIDRGAPHLHPALFGPDAGPENSWIACRMMTIYGDSEHAPPPSFHVLHHEGILEMMTGA